MINRLALTFVLFCLCLAAYNHLHGVVKFAVIASAVVVALSVAVVLYVCAAAFLGSQSEKRQEQLLLMRVNSGLSLEDE
jgi:hypothetical protein